jgi:hypothetical protein
MQFLRKKNQLAVEQTLRPDADPWLGTLPARFGLVLCPCNR